MEMLSENFLKVVSDKTSKFTKIHKSKFLLEGRYPIIDQGQEFIAGYTNSEKDINSLEQSAIIFGDHTRIFKYLKFPFAIGADGVKVLEVNKEKLNPLYTYYYLRSLDIPSAGYSRHYKFLKDKKIQFPESLNDQKRIAKVLSDCEGLIAKRKESIKLLDKLLKSTFLEMFGSPISNDKNWPTEDLGSLCHMKGGKAWKKQELSKTGMRIVRISNLHKPDFPYWHYDGNIPDKYLIRKGDLLFSWAGVQSSIDAYLYDGEDSLLNQHIYNLIPKKASTPKIFLYLILLLYLPKLRAGLGGGVGQFHLKKSDISGIKIILPNEDLVTKYLKVYELIKSTQIKCGHSLKLIENLYGSLSQKAFKGELDVSKVNLN